MNQINSIWFNSPHRRGSSDNAQNPFLMSNDGDLLPISVGTYNSNNNNNNGVSRSNVVSASFEPSSVLGRQVPLLTFNVGGTPFVTSSLAPLLTTYRATPLGQLLQAAQRVQAREIERNPFHHQQQQQELSQSPLSSSPHGRNPFTATVITPPMTTVFLDHNPTAFAVLVDFLRYGRWFVPPAVNRHLVDRLAWDLLGEVVHTDAEANGEAPVPVANLAPRTDVKDGAVPAGDSIAQGRRGSNNSQASLAPPSYSLLPPSHTASSSRNVPPSSSPLQTLVNSVLLPLLATHSTRGHAAVNLIMAPRAVTKSAIVTAEFLEVKIPFEIVHLLQDKDMNAITLIGSDLVNVDGGSSSSAANLDALTCFPTLEFVMQTATRNYLCASLRGAAMHPVHAVKSSVVELTLRTCNEMGLYDSSRVEAVVLRVELHASEETSA